MTDAEKEVATERRMEPPRRCDCGDRAVINKDTDYHDFLDRLRWNEVYYMLNKALK